jgi:hypothetical protein
MGAVDTTYTFTATDTITSAKMNNIIDQTTITTDAIIGTTLDVASGKLKIRSSGITSNEMGSSSVTTSAIANGAVTPAKLSAGGPNWTGTGAGGVFSIPQTGLEFGTGHTQDYGCFIDLHSAATATDFETRIVRDGGVNGAFQVINNGTGAITFSASGGVTFGTANMPTPSGSAPIYGIRAWVNFDASRDASGATNASNTNRFIRSSGNVTSVLKTGTGIAGSPRFACADRTTATTTSIEIETDDATGAAANFTENNVMVVA